jgi:hypothetical protein
MSSGLIAVLLIGLGCLGVVLSVASEMKRRSKASQIYALRKARRAIDSITNIERMSELTAVAYNRLNYLKRQQASGSQRAEPKEEAEAGAH